MLDLKRDTEERFLGEATFWKIHNMYISAYLLNAWSETRHWWKVSSEKQHFERSTTCVYKALKEKKDHLQGNYDAANMSKNIKKNFPMLKALHCSYKAQKKRIAETFKTRNNQSDL